ncbi:MAG: DUF1998 domain-containing protein [Bacteroidota bacterium]
MTSKKLNRYKVGELRPSQALTTFGIGSIIDLPHLSVIVMGLGEWPAHDATEIGEQRLLATVQDVLGKQVKSLRSAPVPPDTRNANPFDASNLVGIPVAPFPQWMVCTFCRRLAPLSSDLFRLETSYRTDQIRYVHANCRKPGKAPSAVPARFIVACKNGHLDDFPWRDFVHRGTTNCTGGLTLRELTATGEAAGIEVLCEGENCNARRRMSDAFKVGRSDLPHCRGRRPHLRDFEEGGCKDSEGQVMTMRPMLQGASNSWFGITLSALAIPEGTSKLGQLIEENWIFLKDTESEQNIRLLQGMPGFLRDLVEYSAADIWKAVQAKKSPAPDDDETTDLRDLKTPEWNVLIDPSSAERTRDFQVSVERPPMRYDKYFEQIVLVERLREVRALVGFSRVESPSDFDNPTDFPEHQRVKLSRIKPHWVPASEIRGEGLFFQFREETIRRWCRIDAVKKLDAEFLLAHRGWRAKRNLEPDYAFYPGIRFILLHSFAHALIRQLSVECGYTSAALRERIYSRNPGEEEPEMAGVLIYTAAADSEGTLGGLVSLGSPQTLERHLDQALDNLRLCASDPLCAEHSTLHSGSAIHGASCHACLFAPETSCERSNKYLDRAVLVPTVQRDDVAFFNDVL